jgi:hypothetical protein
MDACIFCLASLFIQADTGYQQMHHAPAGQYLRYDRNEGSPILAAFSVGMVADFSPKLSMEVSFRHESMPTVYDYGVNAMWISTTWRPFK